MTFLFSVLLTCHAEIIRDGPFTGFDLSKVSADEARAIREASEDFVRVQSGEAPKYASWSTLRGHADDDVRRDHVLYFNGYRYSLVVVKRPIRIGEQHGVIFGPQIEFIGKFAIGYIPQVAHQRFYTREDFAALLKGDGRWVVIPVQGYEVDAMKKHWDSQNRE